MYRLFIKYAKYYNCIQYRSASHRMTEDAPTAGHLESLVLHRLSLMSRLEGRLAQQLLAELVGEDEGDGGIGRELEEGRGESLVQHHDVRTRCTMYVRSEVNLAQPLFDCACVRTRVRAHAW